MTARPLAATSDHRVRDVLDAMPHKIWIVKPDGPAIYYNRSMRAFAGEALSLPDRDSREAALVHADDLARFRQARDAALLEKDDWSIEVRLNCPRGDARWHRLHFAVLRNRTPFEAWLATATDIDDLQQALLATQESSEQLRLAAEAAQLGVYVFDLRTKAHVWSPELKAIFGLSVDHLPPKDIVEWIHAEDRERFRSLRQASLDPSGSGAFQDEHRIVRRDGAVRWVYVKGRVSFIGDGSERLPSRGLGLVLDITDRKLVEQSLARSEERFRALVESASDIVATLDLEGRITSVNPAVERVLGYKPQELIGTPLSHFIPSDEEAMHQSMLQRKLDGERSTQYEMHLLGRDGRQRFTLEVNSKLMLDVDGKPAGIHSIARDVTDRKAAEARQAVLIRELQHRTKNMLAVIQSIATSTLRRGSDLETARNALVGRLHALAHAQEFVASGAGGGAPLRDLVDAELAAFGARASVRGDAVIAGSSFAQMFALVIHELATNATKYGALSKARGYVKVNWTIDSASPSGSLDFTWVERGGPLVEAPAKSGFGTELMSLLGKPHIAFDPEGFQYAVKLPLSDVTR
jgi:PAS domain S-box-containing protein